MKIFFTASHEGKQTYQRSYDKIISVINEHSCDVISLETGSYHDLVNSQIIEEKSKDEVHYLYIKRGMNIANAVIIEASLSKFRLGYETALALGLNKPVLCLSSNKDYSEQIKHPKFYAKHYVNEQDLEKIVAEFINNIKDKHLPVRLHAYVTPEQKNFLEWYGKKKHKTASEIIRQLVDEKMSESSDYFGG